MMSCRLVFSLRLQPIIWGQITGREDALEEDEPERCRQQGIPPPPPKSRRTLSSSAAAAAAFLWARGVNHSAAERRMRELSGNNRAVFTQAGGHNSRGNLGRS